VLDLKEASETAIAALPEVEGAVELGVLVAQPVGLVLWALPLTPQHTHTEEKNHSSFTVPGFVMGVYSVRKQPRLCVLTNSGDLYVISSLEKKLLTSASVSNESIVASTLVNCEDSAVDSSSVIVYMLAGSTGVLSAVSPSLLEEA